MKSNLEETILGEICKFSAGNAFKPEFQGLSKGEIPFIKVSDFEINGNKFKIQNSQNWISKQLALDNRYTLHHKGSTVFAKIGIALTYNRRRLLIRDTAIDNNLMSATGKIDKVDNLFLYYLLSDLDFNLIASGSAIPYLTVSDLNAISVNLPSVNEQKAIAHILGSLDEKIELNQKMNQTLEDTVKVIFKSWFIDFDPVHAKVDGKPTGLTDEMSDLFPNEFENSEIGAIPKGWTVVTLDSLAEITMGQSPPGESYNDDGVGIAFYQGSSDFGFRFPKIRKFCSSPTRYAIENDVLLSVRAPVGDINRALEKCCIGRGLASIRSTHGFPSWIFYRCQFFDNYFSTFNSEGTVFGSVSGKDLKLIKTINPTKPIVQLFENIASDIDKSIKLKTLEIKKLTELRDLLLPKLISGEIQIPNAEKFLEEAGL